MTTSAYPGRKCWLAFRGYIKLIRRPTVHLTGNFGTSGKIWNRINAIQNLLFITSNSKHHLRIGSLFRRQQVNRLHKHTSRTTSCYSAREITVSFAEYRQESTVRLSVWHHDYITYLWQKNNIALTTGQALLLIQTEFTTYAHVVGFYHIQHKHPRLCWDNYGGKTTLD